MGGDGKWFRVLGFRVPGGGINEFCAGHVGSLEVIYEASDKPSGGFGDGVCFFKFFLAEVSFVERSIEVIADFTGGAFGDRVLRSYRRANISSLRSA